MTGRRLVVLAAALLGLAGVASPVVACDVPGDWPTIQQAIWDDACTTITIASGDYQESLRIVDRSVILQSPGLATLSGRIHIRGVGDVDTSGIDVLTSCDGAIIEITQGATFASQDLEVNRAGVDPCPPFAEDPTSIFDDGFESGDAGAWSAVIGG